MNFYSMKNRFVDTFNQPFCLENDKNAIYTVRMMMKNEKNPSIIPGDFALYRVGTFDINKGVFEVLKKPVELVADCSVLCKEVGDE